MICAVAFEQEPLTRGALTCKAGQVEVDEAEFVAALAALRLATNRHSAVARVQHARRRIGRHLALKLKRLVPSAHKFDRNRPREGS